MKSARVHRAISSPKEKRPKYLSKIGRPKTTIKQRLEKIYFDNEKIYQLAKLGSTDENIAAILGIDERTVTRWKKEARETEEGREFLSALKRGKALADELVKGALFHKAIGYSHEDEYIECYRGEVIEGKIVKHYPPDTTAAIFWLKNRDPEHWGDRRKDLSDENNSGHNCLPQDLKDLLDKMR